MNLPEVQSITAKKRVESPLDCWHPRQKPKSSQWSHWLPDLHHDLLRATTARCLLAASTTSKMSSNVRVYVHWKYPVVFSGEDLECTIVFKNVAPILRPSRGPISPSEIASNRQRQQNPAPLQTSTRSAAGPTVPISGVTPPRGRGHRPTVSLNAPLSNEKVPGPGSRTRDQHDIAAFGQKHRRSVSIISLGGLVKGGEDSEGGGGPGQAAAARRSGRNHVRSASLQVLPRWSANGEGGPASGLISLSRRIEDHC